MAVYCISESATRLLEGVVNNTGWQCPTHDMKDAVNIECEGLLYITYFLAPASGIEYISNAQKIVGLFWILRSIPSWVSPLYYLFGCKEAILRLKFHASTACCSTLGLCTGFV